MVASTGTAVAQPLDPATADRFMRLALDCVHREYPNKIAHVLSGDGDVKPPRELTPAFYGCYDWHSAVHGHWLLARLARMADGGRLAPAARDALSRSLTRENIADELLYLRGAGRSAFERPYGLAWLLQLAAELREWRGDAHVARWQRHWSRWRGKRRSGSRTGCPSSRTRFAPASTRRRRSPSGWCWTGRAWRTTWIWNV